LERLLGGDPAIEAAILAFIHHHYGAASLLDLSPAAASEIARRPREFVQAAQKFHQPDLFPGRDGGPSAPDLRPPTLNP